MESYLFNPTQLRYVKMLQQCELNSFQKEFLEKLLGNLVDMTESEKEYLQLVFQKYDSQIQQKIRMAKLLTKL